jgi:hypothetical protein
VVIIVYGSEVAGGYVSDLIRPEEGESVSIGGVDVTFRVSGSETNGAYAVLEFASSPGDWFRRTPTLASRRCPTSSTAK